MAKVIHSKKACAVNPLKMSQPIGAALAFLGLDRCLPMLHGSQGCTAFGLVLFVRHFKETIPLQTTAMNEVTTIMGGMENIENALINIHKRAKPDIIGICSTGLTETKGDDVDGYLKLIRERHPELNDTAIVYVSTPDYVGAFQDGWGKAVTRMIDEFATPMATVTKRVNILAGSQLSVGDVETVREIVESFGLEPVILPDLSGSLDGHIPETFLPTTLGGTSLQKIKNLGSARFTIAIGEQMRSAATKLHEKTNVNFNVLPTLTGLEGNDRFIELLMKISGKDASASIKRQRSQLLDAMLDGHFYFGGKKFVIGAEPDLLWSLGNLVTSLGAQLSAAVTTTDSPVLQLLPIEEVIIGDLEDLEIRATDGDLLITHSHGRQMAQRLSIPFYRAGIPMFDRIGAAHRCIVGYKGTRDLIFELGNMLIDNQHENDPDTWLPLKEERDGSAITIN